MMLRPRDGVDQRLLLEHLLIEPEPRTLSFEQDALGNWIGVARFEGDARVLSFVSEVEVARLPVDPPVETLECVTPASAPLADDEVARWARGFLPRAAAAPSLEVIATMSRVIHMGFRYSRRLEHGVQPPAETLALRSGACRDFAALMVAGARALGLQARFVSGYVHTPDVTSGQRRAGGGHTHAWASVRIPGGGWTDFDPTSGGVGSDGLIRVAVTDEPDQAIPVHGTYFGGAGDFLGMDVEVVVEAAPSSLAAIAREPESIPRVAWNTA